MIKKIITFITIVISAFILVPINNTNAEVCNEGSCINSSSFKINVGSLTPGDGNKIKETAKKTTNSFLLDIIENLMVAMGVIALFVMTLGGGLMIVYVGQDELLSKGKSMFTGGIIALVVALSSAILVKLLALILYN